MKDLVEPGQEQELILADDHSKNYKLTGRPAKYKSPEVLGQAIANYFDSLQEQELKPTITGLALYLGFESRQSFYDYEGRNKNQDLAYIIKRARMFIESEYEQKLHSNCPAGSIFALKNFGWSDKIEHSGNFNIAIGQPDSNTL